VHSGDGLRRGASFLPFLHEKPLFQKDGAFTFKHDVSCQSAGSESVDCLLCKNGFADNAVLCSAVCCLTIDSDRSASDLNFFVPTR